MSAIHRLSSVKPLHEFDIFSVPPMQSTIENDVMTEHRPVSILDSKSVIEFNFSSSEDEYIRLDKTLFYLRMRINLSKPLQADVEKEDWKGVSTVNNFMNSLFKQIDLSIGDRIVNPPHQTYPYKTDIEIKLGKSKDAKETFMTSSFWFESTETDPEKANSRITDLIKYSESETQFGRGREIDLIGRIHLSMFEQTKALVGGCNLRLKFIPNDPSFYLMIPTGVRLKSVDFTESALFIHRSKLSKTVVNAHEKALGIGNARYHIRESFVVPITINKGTMDTTIDNIHNGQLPKRVFVAFVDHGAFNGSFLKNPFNYQNFNICHLSFYLDGKMYPEKPFTPDFENGLYIREYLSLFEATNQDIVDTCITIKRENFVNGNNIFAVNLSPDLTSGCCSTGYVNPIKFGSMRLQVRFKTPLSTAITALVYLDYDKLLEIDKDRSPHLNYD